MFIAGLYAVLRDFLDVRIKGRDDLVERYNIPVLGSVPEFELSNVKQKKGAKKMAKKKRQLRFYPFSAQKRNNGSQP